MKKKKLKKKRTKTLSSVKEKVWKEYSIFIRTRDCLRTTGCASFGLCITCGKRYHIKLLQAGHFLPGRYNANLFYERGTHAQCYNCNINLKGNAMNYQDAIIKLYGIGIIEELRENNQKIVKFIIPELEEKIKEYKIKTKELLRGENWD